VAAVGTTLILPEKAGLVIMDHWRQLLEQAQRYGRWSDRRFGGLEYGRRACQDYEEGVKTDGILMGVRGQE
jgi:hypothetical protein